jgi:hypothetical protein
MQFVKIRLEVTSVRFSTKESSQLASRSIFRSVRGKLGLMIREMLRATQRASAVTQVAQIIHKMRCITAHIL